MESELKPLQFRQPKYVSPENNISFLKTESPLEGPISVGVVFPRLSQELKTNRKRRDKSFFILKITPQIYSTVTDVD